MQTFKYETVDSTNEEAKRLLKAGEIADAALIIAREQTAGKGTKGREWFSPKNSGIYLTVVQNFSEPISIKTNTNELTINIGEALAHYFQEVHKIPVSTKPINDLYLNGKKLAGILTEAFSSKGKIRAIIVGLGINTKSHHAHKELGATSLEEAGLNCDENELINALAHVLELEIKNLM